MVIIEEDIFDQRGTSPSYPSSRNPYDFDSVSMNSQSTVYNSDFVEAEVKRFENNNQNQNPANPFGLHNNQINLSINVINTTNPETKISREESRRNSRNNYQEDKEPSQKFNTSKKFNRLNCIKKPKIYIPLVFVVIGLITTIILISIFAKNNDNENDLTTLQPNSSTSEMTSDDPSEPPTTSEPEPTTNEPSEPPQTTEPPPTTEPSEPSPTTEPPPTTEPLPSTGPPTTEPPTTEPLPSTEPPTTEPPTTEPPTTEPTTSTTTEDPKDSYEIIPKSEWNSTVVPKDPLKTAERVIVVETLTDQCEERISCLKFLRLRQLLWLNTYINGVLMKNIPENFLISSDGTIYEGRGYYEGQHTFDQARTNYNKNSIGVSFLHNDSSVDLNERQIGAFEFLIESFSNDGKLKVDYKLYHKYQLVGGQETAIAKAVSSWSHWRETPKIIRRNEWKAASGDATTIIPLHDDSVISDTNGAFCSELETCSEILREIQAEQTEKYGDIIYNFIFAGDDLLFEGRSFDLNYSFGDGLQILFIGNYTETAPPQSLMSKLDFLYQYGIELEKIEEDFRLYGARQKNLKTPENPGDALYSALQKPPFDKHFDFNVTEPPPCLFLCD